MESSVPVAAFALHTFDLTPSSAFGSCTFALVLRQTPGAVGYHSLVIKPAVVGDLRLEVTMPGNSTATVYVPTPGDTAVNAAGGLEAVKRENGYTIYQVGPGRFEFSVPPF